MGAQHNARDVMLTMGIPLNHVTRDLRLAE